MSIKNIIYSSDVDLSLPNGPGVNEREFVESIDRIFAERVTILVPDFQKNSHELISKFNKKNRKLIFLPQRSVNPFKFFINQINIFFTLRALYSKEENKNQTIFVFRAVVFPIGYMLFVRIYKPLYALRICGDGTFPFLNKHIFKLLRIINKQVMSYLYKNALGCDSVTDIHVKSIAKRFKGNFFKVDNGVNTERFKPNIKNAKFLANLGFSIDDFIIGYTGNFPHIRGGDEIVEAFNFLKKEGKLKFKAIITGDDGGAEVLQRKIFKYNLEGDIKLTGKVDFTEIPLIVSQLDIGVSFLDKKYRGASEQKVRQYLACGVPAIVSPGSSEFVERNGIGIVVEHLNGIENVASEFLKYYELDSKSKKLIKDKARKFAENYISVDSQNLQRLSVWKENLKKQK